MNMSYCRFRNTLMNLDDCKEAMFEGDEKDISEEELSAKKNLIEMCREIVEEFGENN